MYLYTTVSLSRTTLSNTVLAVPRCPTLSLYHTLSCCYIGDVLLTANLYTGIIAYRMENWHNGVNLYDKWASTKGWTKPNDGSHSFSLVLAANSCAR